MIRMLVYFLFKFALIVAIILYPIFILIFGFKNMNENLYILYHIKFKDLVKNG